MGRRTDQEGDSRLQARKDEWEEKDGENAVRSESDHTTNVDVKHQAASPSGNQGSTTLRFPHEIGLPIARKLGKIATADEKESFQHHAFRVVLGGKILTDGTVQTGVRTSTGQRNAPLSVDGNARRQSRTRRLRFHTQFGLDRNGTAAILRRLQKSRPKLRAATHHRSIALFSCQRSINSSERTGSRKRARASRRFSRNALKNRVSACKSGP